MFYTSAMVNISIDQGLSSLTCGVFGQIDNSLLGWGQEEFSVESSAASLASAY